MVKKRNRLTSHFRYVYSWVMSLRQAVSGSLPQTLRPMLARLAHSPFDSSDHLFELKWDGIRAMALVHNGALKLLDRNSRDITQRFPELSKLPRQIKGDGVILDGELVCLDDRARPSYLRLEQRLGVPEGRGSRSNPVHFIAFDLLYAGSQPVMGLPLVGRKALLNDLLAPSEVVQQSDYIESDGKSFFHATCELGLEGILAKEKSSLYLPGRRSRDWLKVKRVRESEFVIAGYTFGGGTLAGAARKEQPFGSLLLGLYDEDGGFRYVGQVLEGISKQATKELSSELQASHIEDCPFRSTPAIPRFIFWCRPEQVCQVEYGEFTEDGILGYPIFKALREDKRAGECTVTDAPGWPRSLPDFP